MLARNYIAQIHIEKQHAGLQDEEYRNLLFEVAGVRSSKNLQDDEADAVIEAIKAEGEQREGWKSRQLVKWRQYLKFCAMSEQEGNELLFKVTGLMSCEAPGLAQADFDMAMAEIESLLEDKLSAAEVPMPGGIDLNFWRSRNPRNGQANRRSIREIRQQWAELCEYLEEGKQNEDYMYGFCAHVCRHNPAKPLSELTEKEAGRIIEAIKQRIEQEKKKLAADVPF